MCSCGQLELPEVKVASCDSCGQCFNCCPSVKCESCDETILPHDMCAVCDSCSLCCDCEVCNGCDERFAKGSDDICSTCDECKSCCECWHCESCDENYTENTSCCSNCDSCESCCECQYCNGCDETRNSDRFCRQCDYCSDCCECSDEEDEDSSVVKQYSADVLDYCSFYGKPKDKTWFGIELEVNVKSSHDLDDSAQSVASDLEDFAILKHDSSIGRGFEIVTAPATLEAHREQWRAFWRSNPTSHLTGYESGSCGMHVHISRPSALVTGKMIVFLNSTENADFVRVIAGRSNSTWAKVCSSKKVTDWNKSYDRYEALNVMNSKTVELRIFRSTLKESSFWKNLEFTHALLHFARTASIDSLTVDSFLAFICQSDNRKQYRNLIAFLVRKGYAMPVKALPLPVKQTEVQLCA